MASRAPYKVSGFRNLCQLRCPLFAMFIRLMAVKPVHYYLGLVARKHVFGVPDKVGLKPVSSTTAIP